MKTKFSTIAIGCCSLLVSHIGLASEQEQTKNDSLIHMVMFTPKGQAAPQKTDQRLNEVADISEKFFNHWMQYWGYPVAQPFKLNRNPNGDVKINYVEGRYTHASKKYENYGFYKKSVIAQTSTQYGLPKDHQFWWAFYYPKKIKKGAYVGGGDFQGGFSRAGFKDVKGDIDVNGSLAAKGTADAFLLKAVVHEMGHALGLPHNGPHQKDGLGNSLMGPVNKVYKRKTKGDERVYLSKASAAMLWKHPVFTGTDTDIDKKINFSLNDYQAHFDKSNNQIIVNGQLKTDYPAHSVVIADTPNSLKSAYWQKMYVCDIKDGGKFTCVINEPEQSSGKLQMVFCFENGAVMGIPKSERTRSKERLVWNKALRKKYSFKKGEYQFEQ
ncbi:hypothetical protein D5018_14725 [Parashewanella curva]|uniref:Peptidase metallopeptidase domain-containing protein n=1 Tax=Parashewanella curva TaxID=2338552 RepID=A0A3L8PWU9_9GAMM|nr:hypothetical protein [Parashewanella curva]RLV58918.1 hypothetical protein D5018_14725 [Parashewanella curva]